MLYAVLKYAAMLVLVSGAPSRPDKVNVISDAGFAVMLIIVKILLHGRWVSLNLHIEKTFRSLLISYGRKVCGISATRGGLVMADLVR